MKWFICQLLDPKGCISAPQAMGVLLILLGAFLALASLAHPVTNNLLVTVFSSGGGLLTAGTFEVVGRSKYEGKP